MKHHLGKNDSASLGFSLICDTCNRIQFKRLKDLAKGRSACVGGTKVPCPGGLGFQDVVSTEDAKNNLLTILKYLQAFYMDHSPETKQLSRWVDLGMVELSDIEQATDVDKELKLED